MFHRSFIAGLLCAAFAGTPAFVIAQTPDSAAAVKPEEFTLSAPMPAETVPVITAPGAAPVDSLPAADSLPSSSPMPAHDAAAEPAEPRTFSAAPKTLPDDAEQPPKQAQAQVQAPAAADPSPKQPPAAQAPSGNAAGTQPAPLPGTSADPLAALLTGRAAPVRIAFLLPAADSPFEAPSQEILQGVLAANYASADPIEVLLVRPGADEPVASQLKRAALAGAMAAIGPLDRSKVAEIASLAYTPLPVVTLNQVDMDTAVALTPEEIAKSRAELEEKRAAEQHIRELVIAETNAMLSDAPEQTQAQQGGITSRSTVPGLVFAEELAVSTVRYEPIEFPRGMLMLGLSMEDDAARVAQLGLAALPPATEQGERPKVLLLDHDTPLEKRVSAAFERHLVAAGFAPDRLTVDLSQFQRVSKFFDLAVERLSSSEFNETLIDREADPVGWRQQQIRIRRLKAAKRARAALAEPPYHAVFLAMDAKTASLVRSRLPMRSRVWGTPMINPGDPKTDPQAKAMTYDLQQVALVESPLVLNFDAAEFEDMYRVPAPQSTVQARLFALGADAFAAATAIARGTNSASFTGLLGTVAYNLTISPKAERRGQTAMIFGGEVRVMDEEAVIDYETLKTNSRRMRAQARSLERLQREAQNAAQKAGTLIDEDDAAGSFDEIDSYNFSDGSEDGADLPDALPAAPDSLAPDSLSAPAPLSELNATQPAQ